METVRQMKNALALAQFQNFHRAAEYLNVSQSSLSQSIKRLEDVYGVPLFERHRTGVVPTVYGKVILDKAKRALGLFDDAHREVDMLRYFQTGRLVIGCHACMAETFVGPALASMLAEHPELRFTIELGDWEDLEPQLTQGNIDLYLAIQPDSPLTAFDTEAFMLPPTVFYCRPEHPYLTTQDPSAFLAENPLRIIVPNMPEWLTHQAISSIPKGWPQPFDEEKWVLRSNDATTNRSIVKNSDAISINYYDALESDLNAGKLSLIPEDRVPASTPLPTVLISRRLDTKPPAMAAFSKALKQRVEKVVKAEETRLSG